MTLTFTDMPERIAHLAKDERGYPVPKFVDWVDGKPFFEAMRPDYMIDCIKHNKCWICGGHLGRNMVFVLGPMCCVNRVTAEPPSHLDCALFAAKNCPFLVRPRMRRLPQRIAERQNPSGVMIERNPGVCAVWVTRSYRPFKPHTHDRGLPLIRVGPADRLEFYREGRPATRDEVEESVNSGLPLLEDAARQQGTLADLAVERKAFERLLDEVYPQGAAA